MKYLKLPLPCKKGKGSLFTFIFPWIHNLESLNTLTWFGIFLNPTYLYLVEYIYLKILINYYLGDIYEDRYLPNTSSHIILGPILIHFFL
jgi:hypothetical protein